LARGVIKTDEVMIHSTQLYVYYLGSNAILLRSYHRAPSLLGRLLTLVLTTANIEEDVGWGSASDAGS
jgi:hypothetical protein